MAARPTWTGFLKLSLVSCPIYLAPALSERDRVHFHQLNPATGNRVNLRPHDAETGEEVDRADLVKGYEYERGQYVTVTKEELDDVQIDASKVLDLTQFVDRDAISPLYLDTPYYVYPDGDHAKEAFAVIAKAMQKRKVAAIGRIVLTSREHPVMLEPFETGMLMSTLHTADEVRSADFGDLDVKIDDEMVDVASSIIQKLSKKFEPAQFHDEYQDALRELVEAKLKHRPKPQRHEIEEPSNVVNLMEALRRSLADGAAKKASAPVKPARKAARESDGKQRAMLLPLKGSGRKGEDAKPASARERRKKA